MGWGQRVDHQLWMQHRATSVLLAAVRWPPSHAAGIPGPVQPAELAQLLTSLAACSSSSAAWNITASTSGLNCRGRANMQVAVHI